MKPAISLSILLPVFSAALLAQQYKSEPAGAPPSEVAPAVASALDATGTKISKADGTAVMEIWLRKAAPSGPKASGDSIALPTIPVGTLLGVLLLAAIGPALTFAGVSAFWEKAIQGSIILAAVLMDAKGQRRLHVAAAS